MDRIYKLADDYLDEMTRTSGGRLTLHQLVRRS
jgi:hypothetical protein